MNHGMAVPEIEVARFAAPQVSVVPVTDVISPKPLDARRSAGHYQGVLLATRTGELRIHESTEHLEPWNPAWRAVNHVPRETRERWHPGTLFAYRGPHMWFNPVPELLSWTIDSGVAELPYLDVEAANDLLKELASHAQDLLNGLYEAAGDLDWSAPSARASRNIRRLCSYDRQAAQLEADADLVDYAQIVRHFPQVYQPELLQKPTNQLAEGCEFVTRFIGRWHPEIKKIFGSPYEDGSGVGLEVLGVRSWYRTALAA